MCHNRGSQAAEELGWKARSYRGDLSKIASALCIGTGRAFHKARPDIGKALDPVLVFIRTTTNLFEFVEYIF